MNNLLDSLIKASGIFLNIITHFKEGPMRLKENFSIFRLMTYYLFIAVHEKTVQLKFCWMTWVISGPITVWVLFHHYKMKSKRRPCFSISLIILFVQCRGLSKGAPQLRNFDSKLNQRIRRIPFQAESLIWNRPEWALVRSAIFTEREHKLNSPEFDRIHSDSFPSISR